MLAQRLIQQGLSSDVVETLVRALGWSRMCGNEVGGYVMTDGAVSMFMGEGHTITYPPYFEQLSEKLSYVFHTHCMFDNLSFSDMDILSFLATRAKKMYVITLEETVFLAQRKSGTPLLKNSLHAEYIHTGEMYLIRQNNDILIDEKFNRDRFNVLAAKKYKYTYKKYNWRKEHDK